jgi:hypothetical protein
MDPDMSTCMASKITRAISQAPSKVDPKMGTILAVPFAKVRPVMKLSATPLALLISDEAAGVFASMLLLGLPALASVGAAEGARLPERRVFLDDFPLLDVPPFIGVSQSKEITVRKSAPEYVLWSCIYRPQ